MEDQLCDNQDNQDNREYKEYRLGELDHALSWAMNPFTCLYPLDAIDYSISLWSWLAVTGADSKIMWPGWSKIESRVVNDCFLCECSEQLYDHLSELDKKNIDNYSLCQCIPCPLAYCLDKGKNYHYWESSYSEQDKAYFAKGLLQELLDARSKYLGQGT